MDQQRRSEINRFADAVRVAIGLPGPPFDMEAAVSALGGTLESVTAFDALFEEEASVRRAGDSFEVRVAPAPDTRKRFSIAHELGHLFLHMGFKVDPQKWAASSEYDVMNRYGTSEEEYEAHEFAGAFLMPEREFREVAKQNQSGGDFDTEAIAAHFGVSVHAATTRGRWLGLFSWS